MNPRLLPIIVSPKDAIRKAMERIDAAPHHTPPAPWGMALVMNGRKLVGVVTDGDIRNALLRGLSLTKPVSSIMTKRPLTIEMQDNPSDMLADFTRTIRTRGALENKYHNLILTDGDGNVLDIVTPLELWKRSEVKIKTAAVIGLGYVGLTLALTLNEFGIRVIGVETNDGVRAKLKKGVPHFYEKGLEHLLQKHVNKNLMIHADVSAENSDIYVLCVGTPVDAKGTVNHDYLRDASLAIGCCLKAGDLVILRSTVPVGTCRTFVIPLLEKTSKLQAGTDFSVAFAPERTVEGRALEELRTLPQVIGGFTKRGLDEASRFFQVFTSAIVPVASLEEAEAVKLLNNGFRDVSFAFANEIAQICQPYGLNARHVIRAANEGYPRNHIPSPSPGVGGACLVKDPFLLAASAETVGLQARLSTVARTINEEMIELVCQKIRTFCKRSHIAPAKAKIFLMGMAFKGSPETSDIRHSTSVDILRGLQKTFPHISIYDPVAHREPLRALGATVVTDPVKGFKGAHCVLVLNNHPSFQNLDLFSLASTMAASGLLFDPWGVYSKEELHPLAHIAYDGL